MAAPTILDVSTILQCANLAGGYAAIDRAKSNTLFSPLPEQLLPEKIQFVRKRVQNRYDKNPSDTTLRDTANLLWSLLGKYGLRALNALDAGGVVVNPSTNVQTYLIQLRSYPQFIVGDAGAQPMGDGDTTLIIIDPQAAPESQDGQVEIHVEGSEQGQDLSDRESYNPVWSAGRWTITWNQGLTKGNLVTVKYPIAVNLIYTTSPSTAVDNNYYATLDGDVTASLLNVQGNIILLSSNTVNDVFIDLFCTSNTGDNTLYQWKAKVINTNGAITLQPYFDQYVWDNPFDGTTFNIVVGNDDSFGGIRVDVTGIDGQIISCKGEVFIKTKSF